jgi:hypothetical protein
MWPRRYSRVTDKQPALASRDLDDNLPERAALTDVGEGFRDRCQLERAVDVDADISGDAQLGQRLEVRGAFLHDEHAHPASCERAGDPAECHRAEQPTHRPTDAPIATARGERSAVGEHRSSGDQIEDQVVGTSAREVLASVIDHHVRAERPHVFELAGVVDARDVRAESLALLDRE